MSDDLTPAQLRRELAQAREQLGLMTIGMGQARILINDLTEQRDEARQELTRLRRIEQAAREVDIAIGQWAGVALSPEVAKAYGALTDALDGV